MKAKRKKAWIVVVGKGLPYLGPYRDKQMARRAAKVSQERHGGRARVAQMYTHPRAQGIRSEARNYFSAHNRARKRLYTQIRNRR